MLSIALCTGRFAPKIRPLLLTLFCIATLGLTTLLPTALYAQDVSIAHHFGEVCFAVADEERVGEGQPDSPADTLTMLDPTTGNTQIIGATNTENIEAISFGPELQIYAADGGQLGVLNPETGLFTPRPQPFGTAGGSIGEFSIGDVDGLAFDLQENILFGVQRRFDGSMAGPRPDFLFAIDPTTGAHIPDYFGPNIDYVLIPAIIDEDNHVLADVDDMQFDPVTGVLYGVMNTDGRSGVLVTIDVATGTPTPIATFRHADNGSVIDDVEGISFANDGTLYASTGDNYIDDPDDLNKLFRVDPQTGLGTLIGPFPTTPNDYEALACLSSEAAIVLRKYTNGPGQAPDDADIPTGPEIEAGATVTWTYIFTNTGVLTLTNLSLTDDQIGAIGPAVNCLPAGTFLYPGESLTCTATGIAQPGQYANVGTVSGDSVPHPHYPVQTVTDTNPSHYFGIVPGISLLKFTNGPGQTPEDADDPTGPQISVGDVVTWTYEVRNTGEVPLSNVTVADNIAGVNPTYASGDTNSNNLLDLDETWLFRATGIAEAGQYANMGTATGIPPNAPPVTDTNPSHYFGIEPGINIVKRTNGEDADLETGPIVLVGDVVTWTYEVRNTGAAPLSNVSVDDNIAGVNPAYVSGDTNGNSLLDLDEVWLYQTTGIAIEGQYGNVGTAIGTPPNSGTPVTDTNPSHYFGATPGIQIIKFTNGEDADTPTGPNIEAGDAVTWTYEIRNTGNVTLSNILVTDNITGVNPVYVSGDTNGDGWLDLDEVWFYQAIGVAVEGQYSNIGTVVGTPPVGPNVTDDNPSHYFGDPDAPPTNLPAEEQPQQPPRSLYLPSVQVE